ncbi:Pr6Pr family membrane protein [Pseudooceanicola sp. CBS1P-1]|uniref:FAR-17a/AIG1-like protein n=1 Tax=Pseudooceanicola albus TaxID=2692189 RepID=A0A6L7GAP7_9RHOB|nr:MULTISPECIES: Pr6Pr family membrane protein [Pseudooceanicola]MBT9384057.1 Pr6Pr family membrane protein [Pseudooceanicola endophyticus]MXN19843.1 hypothetical protein [Pseudooceanicola albus]
MDFRSDALSPLARAVSVLIVVLTAAALVAQFLVTLQAHPEDRLLDVFWRMARYFTILTNVLVLGSFLAMNMLRRALGRVWMGGLTVWIVLTGVVYHVLLAEPATGIPMLADQGLHTVTPLLVLAFWCVLTPKSRMRYRAAFAWLIWPALYAGYAFWRGTLDGHYPYFFLDPTADGWDGVCVWLGLMALTFLLSGFVVVWLGRLFSRER